MTPSLHPPHTSVSTSTPFSRVQPILLKKSLATPEPICSLSMTNLLPNNVGWNYPSRTCLPAQVYSGGGWAPEKSVPLRGATSGAAGGAWAPCFGDPGHELTTAPTRPPFAGRSPPRRRNPLLGRIIPLFRLQRRSAYRLALASFLAPRERRAGGRFDEIRCFCRCYQQIRPATARRATERPPQRKTRLRWHHRIKT